MNENYKVTECQIYLTRRCQLKCDYCVLTKSPLEQELSINEWKEAFHVLDTIGIKTVKILGGEPSIVKNVEDLLQYINNETSIKYAMLSNSLFKPDIMHKLENASLQGYFASVDFIGPEINSKVHTQRKSDKGFDMLMKMKEK